MPNSIRLTDLSVRALKFSDAQTTHWDDALEGRMGGVLHALALTTTVPKE